MSYVGLSTSASAVLGRGETAAVAALLAAAGVIHLVAAPEHASEYLLFGLAFYAMAAVQVAGGCVFAVDAAPRGVRTATIVLSVAIALLWATSRVVGLPIGPEPWQPERIGVQDGVCTLFEILVAAILLRAGLGEHRSSSGMNGARSSLTAS